MKKIVFFILLILSALVLIGRFGAQSLLLAWESQGRAGLKITSLPEAVVFIDGMEAGKTPYENEDLKGGQYRVRLVAGEEGEWEGIVELVPGTLSVVNREITPSLVLSSGETLTLKKGQGIIFTSTPPGSKIEIDGQPYGQTPLLVSQLPSGEHTFLISHSNFLKRSIQAVLPEGMNLHLAVDLAVSEVAIDNVTPAPVVSPLPAKLIVKQNKTGFLRVRDKPSLSGREIGKLTPGTELVLLEELKGWYKVRLEDNSEGYVSASYIQKQP